MDAITKELSGSPKAKKRKKGESEDEEDMESETEDKLRYRMLQEERKSKMLVMERLEICSLI